MAVTKVQSEFIVNDVALAGNPTTSTQSSGNNTTRIATTAFVTAAIDSLIDSAPGTLNTLDEIAAALNDDPSFTTTVNNAIATKLPLAGGTMTGSLTGTTATFTTADNLDTLSLLSTDTDDNSGPNLNMYRNSSSPADNDVIGQVKFTGRNDNTQDVVYASISGKIADASDSSEDGKLRFWTVAGGTNTETLTLSSGKVGIGEPNPAYPLAIQADGVVLRLDGTANTTRSIFFRNTTTANPAQLYSDGSLRIYTEDSSTDITLDAVQNIILDADDGGHVRIKEGGTQYASIYKSGSDAILDSTGDITLDAADRIVLSADDNGEIRLQDGASLYGQFKDDDDRLSIQGLIEDKNMLFVINDGGTPTTALQIDAANGGNATFAGTITTTGITRINAVSGNGAAAQLDLYGRNGGGYGASLIARSRIESVTAGTAYDTDLKFYTTDDSNNLDLTLTLDHDQNATFAGTIDAQGATIGSAATRLKVYSDSTYSGIYNGSSLSSDESLYMGNGSIYLYSDGTERFRIAADNLIFNGKAGTSPIFEMINNDSEDTNTGRETSLRFSGHRSGGEDVINAQISGHHDGSADNDDGLMLFYTNNGSGLTEGLRIDSDQVVHTAGDFKPGADIQFSSGRGINFSATANSSGTMASETMTDYEHGTWNPGLIAGTTNPTGGSVLSPDGEYTRIGNRVWVTFYVGRSWTNSPSGTIYLSGLPYAPSGSRVGYHPVTTYNVAYGDDGIPWVVTDSDGGTNAALYASRSGSSWIPMQWQTHGSSSAGLYVAGAFNYLV